MELTKYGAAEVLYHIKHDLRELPKGNSYGNYSIDPKLSTQNYSLIDRGKNAAEVNKYRKNLEKEIFKYNRKNLVHAIEVLVQAPNDLPESQENAFFIESFEYIASTLPRGKKDIFVAEVHKDEKHYSPTGEMISKDHLHIMYCPAVKDSKHQNFEYKLCADALTKRADLRRMHPELQAHLNSKGIRATVFRKKNGDGKSVSLSVKQLKEITAKTGLKIDHTLTIDELAQIMSNNIELNRKVNLLSTTVAEQRTNITNLSNIVLNKDRQIEQLHSEIKTTKITVDKEKNELQEKRLQNQKLQIQVQSMQEDYKKKDQELLQSQEKIKELEIKHKTVENEPVQKEATWGSNAWGANTGWGTDKTHTVEEEKIW